MVLLRNVQLEWRPMDFFLVQSIKAPRTSALTDDPLGDELPSHAAPWRRDDRDIIDVGPTETPGQWRKSLAPALEA